MSGFIYTLLLLLAEREGGLETSLVMSVFLVLGSACENTDYGGTVLQGQVALLLNGRFLVFKM